MIRFAWSWVAVLVALVIAGLVVVPQPHPFATDGTYVALPAPPSLTLSQQRDSIVAVEARRANIPVSLALAVSHTENTSGDSLALSQRGAVGIMQVLPQYWLTAFPVECYGERSLFDRQRNACVGVHILAQYRRQQGSWGRAFCAYHGSLQLPDACRQYVNTVLDKLV